MKIDGVGEVVGVGEIMVKIRAVEFNFFLYECENLQLAPNLHLPAVLNLQNGIIGSSFCAEVSLDL